MRDLLVKGGQSRPPWSLEKTWARVGVRGFFPPWERSKEGRQGDLAEAWLSLLGRRGLPGRREQGQRFLFFGFYQVELERQH